MNILKSFTPEQKLLAGMTIVMTLTFSVWQVLINNFAVEKVGFTGVEIGTLQSLREVPGFLAFTAVFLLVYLHEQWLALIALILLGAGVMMTGFFPSEYGLYATTILMSVGFHYYETMNKSLTLQWLSREEAPHFMGKMISISSVTGLLTYGLVWVMLEVLHLEFFWIYVICGSAGIIVTLYLIKAFPRFSHGTVQHKHLFVRKRYWLYYALIMMSGARRQIFMVFAVFLLVQKFGYSAADVTLLLIVNKVFNVYVAPKIGQLIARFGERRMLSLEYVGLIFVFIGYGLTESGTVAAALFVVDHLFFALAIGINTYFHKIADPKDIAATSGISFSINHVAAVIIPVLFGIIWMTSPSLVFYLGAGMSVFSLILALLIPRHPEKGNEVAFTVRQSA